MFILSEKYFCSFVSTVVEPSHYDILLSILYNIITINNFENMTYMVHCTHIRLKLTSV